MSEYAEIEVVENPRRRRSRSRRRRTMTAKQRKYFGRRRNPTLATVANPRRRRSRRRSFARSRSTRRYRNPGFLGGMPDLTGLLWMSGGAVATKMAPRLIQSFWPGVPTTGLMGKLVQAGAAFALSQVVKMVAGNKAASDVLNGGLVLTVSEIISENVLPMVGLSGMSGYEYLTYDELTPVMNGAGAGLSGYTYTGQPEMIAA